MQCCLLGRGLAGFVFHQQHGKTHVQCARGGGVTVITADGVGGCPKNELSGELAGLLARMLKRASRRGLGEAQPWQSVCMQNQERLTWGAS